MSLISQFMTFKNKIFDFTAGLKIVYKVSNYFIILYSNNVDDIQSPHGPPNTHL